MTLQLDTSGVVGSFLRDTIVPTAWSDLTPFAQGYVEAMFAANYPALHEAAWQRLILPPAHVRVGFSDLAPATLSRIIADCAGPRIFQSDDSERATGRSLWKRRQSGSSPFPPLTVTLGDDGLIYFRDDEA